MTLTSFRSPRRRLVVALGLGTRGAEMAAKPALEVRDALALGLSFTRLLACLHACDAPGRLVTKYFTGTLIAYGVRSDFHPSRLYRGRQKIANVNTGIHRG